MNDERVENLTGRGSGEKRRGQRLIDRLPVLAVCGPAGRDHFTPLEAAAAELEGGGLRVALLGRPAREEDLEPLALAAVRTHDAVLAEGFEGSALPQVWVGGGPAPTEASNVVGVLEGPGGLGVFAREYVQRQWLRTPVCGCVLIGGRSRRMGAPKHLLAAGGRTWLERTLERMRAVTPTVVIVGRGEVPGSLADVPRLPDPPEVEGPMAGVLAAMRWGPWASWLVAACDLPELSAEALAWLLASRGPGVWATVPKVQEVPRLQTLLAHYDFRVREILERAAADGDFRLARVADHPAARVAAVPPELAGAWRNVNTPEDLSAGARQDAEGRGT